MENPNKLTLLEAIEHLKNKNLTSVELVEACYSQIEKYEDSIKAFVTLTKENALKDAKEADEFIAKHGAKAFDKKPLIGIPYVCKDNFTTYGVQTTASSKILEGYIPPYESTVTLKLKEAGAIVLGKANMDAFAHGSSTETSDYKKTTNPWNYSKVPGGSSGGSAASVAADTCIFAIGSETSGSIRGPAAWCGITGFKPTYGRVSRFGLIAMASSTDSPGPLTKTADDAAYILSIIAGNDTFDATSSPSPIENYLENAKKYDLKGKKIGRPKSYFEIDLEPEVKAAVEAGAKAAEAIGTIVSVHIIPRPHVNVDGVLPLGRKAANKIKA